MSSSSISTGIPLKFGENQMPRDAGRMILDYFSPCEQIKMSCVSKNWNLFIATSLEARFPHNLFSQEKFPVTVIDISKWITCFGKERLESLGINTADVPLNMKAAILRLEYIYTHAEIEESAGAIIFTSPMGLTLIKLKELSEKVLGKNLEIHDDILKEIGNIPLDQSCIEILTNNVFQKSRGKSVEDQNKFVSGIRCVLLRTLSAASQKVFSKIPGIVVGDKFSWTDTPCKEQISGNPIFVSNCFQGAAKVDYEGFQDLFWGAASSVDVPNLE